MTKRPNFKKNTPLNLYLARLIGRMSEPGADIEGEVDGLIEQVKKASPEDIATVILFLLWMYFNERR